MALSKQNLDNFLPNGFETENKEGYKANFSDDKIATGYEKDVADIIRGPNLNNLLDKIGKNFNVLDGVNKYLNNMPINSIPTVNANNQLDYVDNNFLNKTQITNCILSAPNGVATFSGSNITLKQGLKMLYPNGRNIDKTLKNGELTLDSDTILDLSSYSGQTFDFELIFGYNINDSYLSQNYQESDIAPTNFWGLNQVYLNTTENQMYFYDSSLSSWQKKTFIKLGKGKLENGVVTSFTPYHSVELAKQQDIDGMWVLKAQTLASNFAINGEQEISYDLSSYLPNDGNIYECIFSGYFRSNNSVGDSVYIYIKTDIIKSDTNFCECNTSVLNITSSASNNCILPVGLNRTVTIKNAASSKSNNACGFYVKGYRKVK